MKELILIGLMISGTVRAEQIALDQLDFDIVGSESRGATVQNAVVQGSGDAKVQPAQSVSRPNEVPLKVYVDKTNQLMTIIYPDPVTGREREETMVVSTGGGLKIPNFEDERLNIPYCAETPNVESRVMRAREGVTMKRLHESGEFRDEQGRKAPMPNAILIDGQRGIYFHKVLPQYEKFMGQARSGGCVRLKGRDSERLYSLMQRFGAVEINIYGQSPQPPEAPKGCLKNWSAEELRRGCTPEMVAAVKHQMQTGNCMERTGSEGSFSSLEELLKAPFKAIGSIFGGGGGGFSSSGNSGSSDETAAQPAPTRRKRDLTPGDLMQRGLGGGI